MQFTLEKFGDWTKAGMTLQALAKNLKPTFQARLYEDSQLILQRMVEHIDRQDLGWTPLADTTVRLKGGSTTIYVESGYLRDNLSVRKIKSSDNAVTYFIGASAWKTTPSGVKFSDLMIWLEYGTDKIPPRPLIRPTYEQVAKEIQDNWGDCLKTLIEKGGSF